MDQGQPRSTGRTKAARRTAHGKAWPRDRQHRRGLARIGAKADGIGEWLAGASAGAARDARVTRCGAPRDASASRGGDDLGHLVL